MMVHRITCVHKYAVHVEGRLGKHLYTLGKLSIYYLNQENRINTAVILWIISNLGVFTPNDLASGCY